MNEIADNRPDPDELLASLMNDEDKSKKGRLKIFFGMCAGVGKTYSMLQAARAEKLKETDIIIGLVETHNRKETEALLQGFELIPRRKYEYRSAVLDDMDIDAIIARHPQIVIVDELAHSNAPGSRHAKRYQDVLEILENGISVYTTLNVQHLESRSETVAQITGITVRETLPDEIFENADEVELVDLTPDELLQRFSEGKIYTPDRSKEAVGNFFRKGNITALREMALRIVADRVDKQLHDYLQYKRIRGPWKSGLHLLVAIDYQQQSTRLLRWAKNLSYSMGAQIQAVYVETTHTLTEKERKQLDKNINLAKQLGIKVRIKTGNDKVKAIVGYAQKENITHIIIGKPRVRNVLSMFRLGNFLNRIIRYSGNIDVYILGSDTKAKDSFEGRVSLPPFTSGLSQYLLTTLMVILTSTVFYLAGEELNYQTVSFGLLILVSVLAIFYGTGPILVSAILSAVIWDFFFIPPRFTLYIEKPLDMLMLAMFFIIALLNGVLTSRVRRQEKKIRIREERTHALYQLTRDLSTISGYDEVAKVAAAHIRKYFLLDPIIFMNNELNQLERKPSGENKEVLSANEISILNWAYKHTSKAGKYTETLPSTEFTFYPLVGQSGNTGVMAVKHQRSLTFGEEQFWEACLSQIAGKFERELLRDAAKRTYVLSETEKLYKTLFNSISHEFRIPVAAIMGASDMLLEQDYTAEVRSQLYREINTASVRLNRLIENLLNMSRLESGRLMLHPDWCDVHDLASIVNDSLKNELKPFRFSVIIPMGMPLVFLDFGLIEQALHNLILNATQYAPEGSRIRLKFFIDDNILTIQVMDRGPGFPEVELASVFDKFYRGNSSIAGGTGLGLSIVKGFAESHHGTVMAENRKNGGAIFTIKIPVRISEINAHDLSE